MTSWSPQRYRFEGERKGIDADVIEASIAVMERIQFVDPRLPIILTLGHFSKHTSSPYSYLRKVVGRKAGRYKRVLFRKKVPGRSHYREIHIPEPSLLEIQRWIAREILSNTTSHPASFAYHPNSQPVYAASRHCGCKWLLKVDIEDFFHSISEHMVYDVFRSLGYTNLFSFELARITTVVIHENTGDEVSKRWTSIPGYYCPSIGVLPQGAPTSPMLSNLVMKNMDEKLDSLARLYGFKYTRYSDDLAFSTNKDVTRQEVGSFKKKVNRVLLEKGFNPNRRKSVIRGPGSRRIILGILVDSDTPRLSREYKDQLRQHLYYLSSGAHGPAKHANARKMSISTLFHHVRGKIAWAEKVEPRFGAQCLVKFESVDWPHRRL
jgi:RNA-directed DNA polymerase